VSTVLRVQGALDQHISLTVFGMITPDVFVNLEPYVMDWKTVLLVGAVGDDISLKFNIYVSGCSYGSAVIFFRVF